MADQYFSIRARALLEKVKAPLGFYAGGAGTHFTGGAWVQMRCFAKFRLKGL
jgi:hypothetical protein